MDHPDRRADWGERVFAGGGCAGREAVGRSISGIWEEVENPDARDADPGQSFGGELRRAGRTEPGGEEVRESARGVYKGD